VTDKKEENSKEDKLKMENKTANLVQKGWK
jgi:hypothetical protein